MYRNIVTGATCYVSKIEELNGETYVFYRRTKPVHAIFRTAYGEIQEIKDFKFTNFRKPKRIFDLFYKKID